MAILNEYVEASVILQTNATLGEGALWHPEEHILYWIDIEERTLYLFNPETKENRAIPVKERIGTVVPAAKGGALVALQNGIHHVNTQTGSLTCLLNPLAAADIRFNDGKCDSAGRFWVGTMALDSRAGAAVLYRLDKDGSLHQMLDKLTISNGIVWSGDNKTMYFTDTPTQKIKAFDFDLDSGKIVNERTVINIPEKEGAPDGMTIDEAGNVWVALHGGGIVICYDPATGMALQKVKVACPQTTSCAFGGENLDTLYITTGRQGLNEKQLKEFPLSGSVFAIKPGIKGLPANFYEGEVYTK